VQLQCRAASWQSCRGRQRGVALSARTPLRAGRFTYRAPTPRRALLLRRRCGMVQGPVALSHPARELRCRATAIPSAQLRRRPQAEPVQLRHRALGLRHPRGPAGLAPGLLDVELVAILLKVESATADGATA